MATNRTIGRTPLEVVTTHRAQPTTGSFLTREKPTLGSTTPTDPNRSFDSAKENVTPSSTFTEPLLVGSIASLSTIDYNESLDTSCVLPSSSHQDSKPRASEKQAINPSAVNPKTELPGDDTYPSDYKDSWREPTSPLPSTPIVLGRSRSTLFNQSANTSILDSPSVRRFTRPTGVSWRAITPLSNLLPGLKRDQTFRSNSTNDSLSSFASPEHIVSIELPAKDLVQCYPGVQGLYVGYEDKILPPVSCTERWSKHVEPRLKTDMIEFQKNILRVSKGRTRLPAMSWQLRMSGYASTLDTHVQLSPRIWILYTDKRWKKEIKRFARESEWLEHEGFGKVEVRQGGPRPSTKSTSVLVEGLVFDPQHGFSLGEGLHVYLHVENPQHDCSSVNGLILCATTTRLGQVHGQRLSRIGGSISVNSTNIAVTTGHGIFELIMNLFEDGLARDDNSFPSFRDDPGHDSDSNCFPYEDSSDDESGWDSDMEGQSSEIDELPWPCALGEPDTDSIKEWTAVELHGLTSFLGINHVDLIRLSHQFVNHVPFAEFPNHAINPGDTDFSLWSLRQQHHTTNEFSHAPGGSKVSVVELPNLSTDESLQVIIILGPEKTLNGTCLAGFSEFMVQGVIFTTRKIRTEAPLALGCSGAWVVTHDTHSLMGMVIAAHQNEPYIHMVTRERLFADIKGALPAGFDVTLSPRVEPTTSSDTGKRTEAPAQYERAAGIMKEITSTERQRLCQTPALAFHMTLGARQNILEKLGLAIFKAHQIPQDFSSGDEEEVKDMVRFRLQLGAQYTITPRGTILKEQLSITEHDLADGIALVEHILRRIPQAERPQICPSGTESHAQILGWVKAMTTTQTGRSPTRPETPPSSVTPPRVAHKRAKSPSESSETSRAKKIRQDRKSVLDSYLQSIRAAERCKKSRARGTRKRIRPATTDGKPIADAFAPPSPQQTESQTSIATSQLTGTNASDFTADLRSTPASSSSALSRDFGFSQPITDDMEFESEGEDQCPPNKRKAPIGVEIIDLTGENDESSLVASRRRSGGVEVIELD